MQIPRLIEFSKIGKPSLGYISVAQNSDLPFDIKRVYWTYYTPDAVVRGHHAHRELEQIIFAVNGQITFILEDGQGQTQEFRLESPNQGLYIPKLFWRTIKFSHSAVLMCLASLEYSEEEYIRDYDEFRQLAAGASFFAS